MKIHEYQARALLQQAGIPTPPSRTIDRPGQAREAFAAIGAPTVVVKAQVHAGGRGKAGYVKLVKSADEAEQHSRRMFENPMVSVQTGPQGVTVRKILMAAAVEIAHEYYVGITLDRSRRTPVLMASAEGGVEIEVVAEKNPAAIHKAWFHPHLGLMPFQAAAIASAIGLEGAQAKAAASIMLKLARLFVEKDCTLAEINPLVRLAGQEGAESLVALDAKLSFDDNALFRHADLAELADPTEENPSEVRAREHNLNYIALDGNIGCVVNGAGLAMATMDIVKLHGGAPANFLDVGGSVTSEGALEAFRIILSDKNVRAILVNIFGGIAKCDVIADALIHAAREFARQAGQSQAGFPVPVVVRLEGTHVDRARQMLAEANVPGLTSAPDLTAAAKLVCAAV